MVQSAEVEGLGVGRGADRWYRGGAEVRKRFRGVQVYIERCRGAEVQILRFTRGGEVHQGCFGAVYVLWC